MPEGFSNKAFMLQHLMDNMTDHIYFKDANSRFILVNESFCDWVGLARVQIEGQSDFDLFAEDHARKAFEDEQEIILSGNPLVGLEEKETWPDGRVTWVSTTKMPLRNESGKIIGTFGISRDITAHKESELRAMLYSEQIRVIKEEMEEDVRMAGELQKTFFPNSYPTFPPQASEADSCVQFYHHYHSSGMVSGDFCSVRRISDTQAGIFLCDVMGHGVRAALGTALIRAIVEELSDKETDPGTYLASMNTRLIPLLRQDDMFLYATACYMVLDTATGALRFSNAGHSSPILLSGKDKAASWMLNNANQRGPALAISDGAEYPVVDISIQADDTVIMVTDGLLEVIGGNDEEYGEDRLREAACKHIDLPLPDLFPSLVKDACLFSNAGSFDDDVCLVGFKLRSLQ